MQGSRVSIWGRIAAVLITAVLYYLLATFCTIDIGQIRISIDQLPVLLLAILFGPIESAVAALLGGLVYQVQIYGWQWMLAPWLLVYTVRGLIVGYGCRYLAKRNDDKPWKKPVQFMALLCFAAVVTTIVNTVLIWVTARVEGSASLKIVFDNFYTRLFLSTVISLLIGITLPPISYAIEQKLAHMHASVKDSNGQAY